MIKKPITISSCDLDRIGDFNQFAAIINVNDYYDHLFASPVPYYWFPIHEVHLWGYAPFYGSAKIFDHYKNNPKPILIHCAAGVNRSVTITYAILKSSGWTDKEIKILYPNDPKFMFDFNVKRGYINPDVLEFLKKRHEFPTYSIMGLLNEIKSVNTYYKKNY